MLQLGFNEATCKENSCVAQDIRLCSKFGYQAIELRLDMLKAYFKAYTIEDLKALLEKRLFSWEIKVGFRFLAVTGQKTTAVPGIWDSRFTFLRKYVTEGSWAAWLDRPC